MNFLVNYDSSLKSAKTLYTNDKNHLLINRSIIY